MTFNKPHMAIPQAPQLICAMSDEDSAQVDAGIASKSGHATAMARSQAKVEQAKRPVERTR